jgi:hypothetical protein
MATGFCTSPMGAGANHKNEGYMRFLVNFFGQCSSLNYPEQYSREVNYNQLYYKKSSGRSDVECRDTVYSK